MASLNEKEKEKENEYESESGVESESEKWSWWWENETENEVENIVENELGDRLKELLKEVEISENQTEALKCLENMEKAGIDVEAAIRIANVSNMQSFVELSNRQIIECLEAAMIQQFQESSNQHIREIVQENFFSLGIVSNTEYADHLTNANIFDNIQSEVRSYSEIVKNNLAEFLEEARTKGHETRERESQIEKQYQEVQDRKDGLVKLLKNDLNSSSKVERELQTLLKACEFVKYKDIPDKIRSLLDRVEEYNNQAKELIESKLMTNGSVETPLSEQIKLLNEQEFSWKRENSTLKKEIEFFAESFIEKFNESMEVINVNRELSNIISTKLSIPSYTRLTIRELGELEKYIETVLCKIEIINQRIAFLEKSNFSQIKNIMKSSVLFKKLMIDLEAYDRMKSYMEESQEFFWKEWNQAGEAYDVERQIDIFKKMVEEIQEIINVDFKLAKFEKERSKLRENIKQQTYLLHPNLPFRYSDLQFSGVKWEAHHIIPIDVAKRSPLIRKAIGLGLLDLNNEKNGIILPNSDIKDKCKDLGLYLATHKGSHPAYSHSLEDYLKDQWETLTKKATDDREKIKQAVEQVIDMARYNLVCGVFGGDGIYDVIKESKIS